MAFFWCSTASRASRRITGIEDEVGVLARATSRTLVARGSRGSPVENVALRQATDNLLAIGRKGRIHKADDRLGAGQSPALDHRTSEGP